MIAWIKSLDAKCAMVFSVLGIIGAIASGVWMLDGRYARADDVVAQAHQWQKSLTDIKVGQARSDRRILEREKFELEQVKSKRTLTTLEEHRYRAVLSEIAVIDQEIEVLRRKP